MSPVLVLARREVRERLFILATAFAFTGLTLGLRFAPFPRARDVADALALLLFMAFPAGVALAVGSSLVGRDLAERRLSFYFSRPLSTVAIWAGKLLGGAFLVLGTFLCFFVPVAWSLGGLARLAIVFWTLFLLGLMGVAHVAGTMYRSRSRLFALDLGLAAVFVAFAALLLRELEDAGAGLVVFEVLGPVVAGLAVLVTAAAAAAQLAYGRTDARRGHQALSVTAWSLAFVVLGALALWASWLLAVTPRDVGGAGFPLFAAPRGSAVFFRGFSEQGRVGYNPCFLLDGESGAFLRLSPEHVTGPVFSEDGRVAVWVAMGGASWAWAWFVQPYSPSEIGDPEARLAALRGATLAVARLDGDRPSVEERPLHLPDVATGAVAVDGDGTRALVATRAAVFLVSAADGAVLSQQPLPDVITADFRPDGFIRVYRSEPDARGRTAFVVQDWNPRDGSRADRARVSGDGFIVPFARRGDLVVVSTGPHGRALIDAANGSVTRLDSQGADRGRTALVLSDGRIALGEADGVRVVTREGATVVFIPIDSGALVNALQEPAAGELAIGLWNRELLRTLYVDAATGARRREEKGLVPAGRSVVIAPPSEPGSLASRLLTDLQGSFIVVEPDGRRREVVSGRR